MKKEYTLSKMRSRPNPYAAKLKRSVTMRVSDDVLNYFKTMSAASSMPYQSLINLYLRDCVMQKRQLKMDWVTA